MTAERTAQAIEALFATKILPRVEKLRPGEISCRVVVPGAGTWELGERPVRAEVELDGEALLTLRATEARDTAAFVRSGESSCAGTSRTRSRR